MDALTKASEHVQKHARFMPDSPLQPYSVRYPNPKTGEFFCSADTHTLAAELAEYIKERAA